MMQPHDGAVVLIKTRTGFEAEAIAEALRARGIEARAADTASAMMLPSTVAPAKVLVPASVETLARQVLDEVRAEMSDIDWAAMDLGPEEDVPRMKEARRGRRIIATLGVLLVPIGLAVLAAGVQRRDIMLQAIGGAVSLTALVIALTLTVLAGRKLDPDD